MSRLFCTLSKISTVKYIFWPLLHWEQQSPGAAVSRDSCCQQGAPISRPGRAGGLLPPCHVACCSCSHLSQNQAQTSMGRAFRLTRAGKRAGRGFAFPALLAVSGVTCEDTSLECALLLRLVGQGALELMGFKLLHSGELLLNIFVPLICREHSRIRNL